MWPMLIMGALSAKQNADAAQRQTELDSNTQRYSPWTRMPLGGTGEVHTADTAGTLAQMYAGYQGQKQMGVDTSYRRRLMEAQIAALNRSPNSQTSNPYSPLRGDGSTDLYGNGAFSNVG